MTSGRVSLSTDNVFQEMRPGAGFETGDFVEETLGGATVERLTFAILHIARALFATQYLPR